MSHSARFKTEPLERTPQTVKRAQKSRGVIGLATGGTGTTEHKNIVPETILANFFFLLFVAQILSPQFGAVTIYLEVPVALLSPGFRRWIGHLKIGDILAVAFPLLLGIAALQGLENVAKLLALIVSVGYLAYTFRVGLFYLYRYVSLSVFVAIAQYILVRLNSPLAVQIGPTAISEFIWGEHATATNTNFYAILGDAVRVSGLSREAGFFASLTMLTLAILLYTNPKGSWPIKVLLTIGFAVSLSKISFALIPVIVIAFSSRIRNLLDGVPLVVTLAVATTGQYFLAIRSISFLLQDGNMTFFHRFGANLYIGDVSLWQLLVGGGTPQARGAPFYQVMQAFDEPAGLSGFIAVHGLILLGVWLVVIKGLGFTSSGLVVIILGTLNVDLFTNQNFVSLAYFLALLLASRNKFGREVALRSEK